MAANRHLRTLLDSVLEPQEVVRVETFAQVKDGGGAARFAKDFGVSLIGSAALSATGLSMFRVTVPPRVGVVVTSSRLLLVERPGTGTRVGELVMAAPLAAVSALDASRTAAGVVDLRGAESGETLAMLHFGLRKGSAREVVAALAA